MTNAVIREQLHQYIDITDDKKVEALYTLLQNDIETKYVFNGEEMTLLHERAEKYLAGGSKTYTVTEAHNRIRQQNSKL